MICSKCAVELNVNEISIRIKYGFKNHGICTQIGKGVWKDVHVSVHSNIIHNSQKWEINQMSSFDDGFNEM